MKTMNLYAGSKSAEHGYLTLIESKTRKTYELANFNLIGRDPIATIQIADEFASLRHARIERLDEGYLLRDLRSLNGTYLNGSRINEAPLRDQDRIRIGVTEMVFSTEKDDDLNPLFLSSRNTVWNDELQRLPAMAQSPHPILILGPSGSGKEVLANLAHKFSGRAHGPFLGVNCSALSESLIESELFGHVKGSFTGANSERKGAFETARGGTLFLDEIGDLPISLQPKLLRALENSEIKPVGSDRPISTDVRIVAATNQDIERRVNDGRFRSDLYYRLHILQIHPPALRNRIEDIEDLVTFFAKGLGVRFSPEALAQMHKHDWPGNIRELKNVILRATALYPGQTISVEDLRKLIESKPPAQNLPIFDLGLRESSTRGRSLQEIERGMIVDRLRLYNGNQRRVAFELGIPKSTLHDRLKRYQINAKQFRFRSQKEPEQQSQSQRIRDAVDSMSEKENEKN